MGKGRNSSVVHVRLRDELVVRLELLAHQRRQTMSDLLRHIIGQYTARRYSPGRPRRRVDEQQVGILSSVPALKSASSVLAAPGARLTSEVGQERLASEVLVFSFPEGSMGHGRPGEGSGGSDIPFSFSGDRYPGTARSAPCPCGSGEKYKHCHGKGAPPKERR
jgi:hypothetical protein